MLRAAALAAAAALFAADAVVAQNGPLRDGERREQATRLVGGGLMLRPAGLLFASFDADGDYVISESELSAGVAGAFRAADADGSGDVKPLEYADWAGRALGDRAARPSVTGMDTNADGSITSEEFRAAFVETAALYRLPRPGAGAAPAGETVSGGIPFARLVLKVEPREVPERPEIEEQVDDQLDRLPPRRRR